MLLKIYKRQLIQPDFQIFLNHEEEKMEEYDGDLNIEKVRSIVWIFKMPLLATGRHINLEISDEEIYIKTGKIYEISLRIPVKVNENTTKAEFYTEKKELRIEIEVKNILKEALNKATEENKTEIKEKREQKIIEMKSNLLFDLV